VTTGIAVLALLVTGLLPGVMSPPVGWIFLHPIAWIPAFAVFDRLSGRRAFLAGWLVGSLEKLVVLYWITHSIAVFSNLPGWVGVLCTVLVAAAFGLHLGFFAWGFGRIRRASGSWWPFAIAAWFTACEFLNPQLFPYYHGVGWYRYPSIFLLVSLTGISGVSFLVVLVNALLLEGLRALRAPAARRSSLRNAALGLVLLVLAFGWSAWRDARIARAEAETPPLRIALVQSNLLRDERRAVFRQSRSGVADLLVSMSREALEADPSIDVFVFPEDELWSAPSDPWNAAIPRFARENGVEVWTGGAHFERRDGRRRKYNSAYRIRADGTIDPPYDKNVLLPFGEFVPFEDVFPVLKKIQGPGRLLAGTETKVFQRGDTRFAFFICYEVILQSFVRDAVRRGVNLLVNLTFDGWFGDTAEPHQHLMLALVQSAQHGVPLVRSTGTGISAIADARGVVTAHGGVFRREVVVGDVRPVRVPSPYTALGDWFAWVCVAASALLLVRGRRGRSAAVSSNTSSSTSPGAGEAR
jgi:apolipoprotein N-acyltransferase